MKTEGSSTLVDLLFFCTLISIASSGIVLAYREDAQTNCTEGLAKNLLFALLFSTADDVGYRLGGYEKNISGKTWGEVITDSVFLYFHQQEAGKILAENVRARLDRKIREFDTGGFRASVKITSPELPTLSISAGENSGLLLDSAAVWLACPGGSDLKAEVRVEIWRK